MRIIIFFFFNLLSNIGYSQFIYRNNECNKLPDDQRYEILHGKIKIIKEQFISSNNDTITKEFGFDIKGNNTFILINKKLEKQKKEFVFDETGKLLKELLFYKNKLIQQTILNISKSSKLSLYYDVQTLVNEKIESIKKRDYDSSGFLIKSNDFIESSLPQFTAYSYDNFGQLKNINTYFNFNNEIYDYLTINYINSNLVDSVMTTENGKIKFRQYYIRNKQGNITKHNFYEFDPITQKSKTMIFEFILTIDKKENWIKRIEKINDNILGVRTRVIKYW